MDALFPFIQRATLEAADADPEVARDGSQILATAVLYYILETFNAAASGPAALEGVLEAANVWIGTRGALLFPEHGERLLAEAKRFCEDYARAASEKAWSSESEAMDGIWQFVRANNVTDANELFFSVAAKNESFALKYNMVIVLMAQGQYSSKAFAKFLSRRKAVPTAPLTEYARFLYREKHPHAPLSVISAAVDKFGAEFAEMQREYSQKLEERASDQARISRRAREERIGDHLRMMAKHV